MKNKQESKRIVITEEMRANPFPIDADRFMQALAKAYSKETGQTWVPIAKSSDRCLSEQEKEAS